MNLDPILQNVIDGLVLGQQTLSMRSLDLETPDTDMRPIKLGDRVRVVSSREPRHVGPNGTEYTIVSLCPHRTVGCWIGQRDDGTTKHLQPGFTVIELVDSDTKPLPSPGMEPPRPMGCPNCARAEAEVDRLSHQVNTLQVALDGALGRCAALESDLEQREGEVAERNSRYADAKAALAFRDADVSALSLEIKRLNDLSEWKQSRVEHLLGYLSEIRVACGDGGKREGQELVDYLRILFEEADPDRVSKREAEVRAAQDYATPHDPSDTGAWGEDRFEAAS